MCLDLLGWGGGRLNSSDGSFVVIALLCSIGDGGGIALLCSMLSERGASGFYKGGVRGPLPQAGDTVHYYLLIKILVEYEKGEGSPWFPWLNS